MAALAVGAAILVEASPAMAAPTFKVPFPCGQVWSGQTRTNHSPANAVDFNRTDDLGDPVVASAPGTVDVVTNLGGTSYGKYVRINHGSGYTTYYAHLNAFNVSVGQTVGYGQSSATSAPPAARPARTCTTSSAPAAPPSRSSSTARTRSTGAPRTTPATTAAAAAPAQGTVNTAGIAADRALRPRHRLLLGRHRRRRRQRVTIHCQTTGTTVTGTYGTSNIWDRIGSGRYISDAYVYTGYDGFIPGVPRC